VIDFIINWLPTVVGIVGGLGAVALIVLFIFARPIFIMVAEVIKAVVLYIVGSTVAKVILLVAFVGYVGVQTGANYERKSCDAAKWKSQYEAAKAQIENHRVAEASAIEQRDKLAVEADALSKELDEYEKFRDDQAGKAVADKTPAPCVNPDAARRLRNSR
jgi:hypothetical protein